MSVDPLKIVVVRIRSTVQRLLDMTAAIGGGFCATRRDGPTVARDPQQLIAAGAETIVSSWPDALDTALDTA